MNEPEYNYLNKHAQVGQTSFDMDICIYISYINIFIFLMDLSLWCQA